jgi:hypothetical protein
LISDVVIGVIQNQLTSRIIHDGYSDVSNLRFDDLRVFGISGFVSSITVNGQAVDSWTQNTITRVSKKTGEECINESDE